MYVKIIIIIIIIIIYLVLCGNWLYRFKIIELK